MGVCMNLNKKYIILGLVLLIAAWVGNVFYYQSHSLKQPIFLKHFYEVKQGMEGFSLYYIDNINSEDNVNYIVFPEIGDDYLSVTSSNYNDDNRYYRMKVVTIKMITDYARTVSDELKNKVITKATIGLNNGKKIDVDIGKIYLYNDQLDNRDLEFESSGGTSDNSGYTELSSLGSLSVYEINSKFPELVDDMLEIKVDETPLKDVKFPFDLKFGDWFKVSYKFNFKEKDLRRNNVYNFTLDVLTQNSSGEKGSNSIFVHYQPHFPEMYDIYQMLSNEGDI
jgi:hypothetical protein